jgi:hypothetical protein
MSKSSHISFHDKALRKMKGLEGTLIPIPEMIPRLSKLLNLREDQCVYCECPVASWDNKNVEGDEVYPCTMPGINSGEVVTINGRYNKLNKYTCCTPCNSSKGQKINEDFESWVDRGGNSKPEASRIPIASRQRIIDWYNCNKYWITTDNEFVIKEMTDLYKEIQIQNQSPTRKHFSSILNRKKDFSFNDELISLFERYPDKTRKGLSDYLGFKPKTGSSGISQWCGYKTQKAKTVVPSKYHEQIRLFFKV